MQMEEEEAHAHPTPSHLETRAVTFPVNLHLDRGGSRRQRAALEEGVGS